MSTEGTWRSCEDCGHCVTDVVNWWCTAPQLADILDDQMHEKNTITHAQAARDVKMACGHAARWFVQKGSIQ